MDIFCQEERLVEIIADMGGEYNGMQRVGR